MWHSWDKTGIRKIKKTIPLQVKQDKKNYCGYLTYLISGKQAFKITFIFEVYYVYSSFNHSFNKLSNLINIHWKYFSVTPVRSGYNR